jgi:chitodextrinase
VNVARSAGSARLKALVALLVPLTAVAVAQPVANAAAPEQDASHSVVAQKPYLGWSSWSLQSTNYPGVNPTGPASWLTEEHVLQQADVMAAKLKSHGYEYINVDAGWLGGFDDFGRPIVDTKKFPDGMKHVGDYVHAKGLKLGSYLAVGLDQNAYRGGATPIFGAPDCHTKDIVYPDLRKTNGWDTSYLINYASPCAQAYANSIADELAGWGVDFLKMDGVGPGSAKGGVNYDNTADITAWNKALKQTGRSIQFTVSWSLSHKQADFWKANTNGWRIDTDVECYCDTLVKWDQSVKQRWNDVVQWIPDIGPGHWANLDSVDVGSAAMDGLTDIERQSHMTLWAIEAAPLYSGDDLTKLDAYGLSLLTNDEVIALDQAGVPAKPVSQAADQQVWYARNADGSTTVALFNLGAAPAKVTADWADVGLTGKAGVRDLWSHQDLGTSSGSFGADLPSHGSRLLRITPRDNVNAPSLPVNVRAIAANSSTVTLSWDASPSRKPIDRYDVYSGNRKVASVRGTTATVSGLAPSTGYGFTVVAVDNAGKGSVPSRSVPVTTTGSGGPVTYEAEAAGNTLVGGASVGDCGGCSGGKKVGNVGGTASVTINGVTAATAGTYVMTVGYVDGDSSRTAVVTVNGKAFNLPFAGSNNNDWDTAQTVTVPVQLKAGANTVGFGNPGDYVADIDKITL